MKKAFTEELDLLESHYDEQIFRSQHSGLIAQVKERLTEGPAK
jgi:hypothetical protein